MDFEKEAKKLLASITPYEYRVDWTDYLAEKLRVIFEAGKATGRQEAIAELRKEYATRRKYDVQPYDWTPPGYKKTNV